MRRLALAASLPLVLGCAGDAGAACVNASSSVTIPLSGAALVTMYDQACDVLPGTSFAVTLGTSNGGVQVNGTSIPALTEDSTGLHFAANEAAIGAAGSFFIRYTPNGQTTTISYVVGAPITSISAGTTTP